ncbi:MAG: aminopeptidase P family N-terminal domain-containing protein, partial [Candidatus Aminicenantaceae bacterium]
MGISRRKFIKNVGCGMAGLTLGTRPNSYGSVQTKGDSEKLLVKDPKHPKAATADRLPLEWYKKTVARLREKAGERGADAIVLQGRWNIVYFTGLFHSTTERPFYAVIPVHEDALYWYHPGLDRDLVKSWWSTDNAYYFDYLHAEGGYPNLGMLDLGHRVDLFEWLLQGLKARGFGEKVIGFDTEFPLSRWNRFAEILPKAKVVDISDICLNMRMVKTEEEIAL